MNTLLAQDRHRHLRQLNKSSDKVCPNLRKAAWHGISAQRQGRVTASVWVRGIQRIYMVKIVRYEKSMQVSSNYPVLGSNIVETVRYSEPQQSTDKGLVWINKKQYFKNVPPEVWNFCIGGCLICQKWLKDREGYCLSNKDIQQYQRIVTALNETIKLMAGIEAVFQMG